MILTKKALIDFRNWLLSEYGLRWHEFEDMPYSGQYGYYAEFLKLPMLDVEVIKLVSNGYNFLHDNKDYES